MCTVMQYFISIRELSMSLDKSGSEFAMTIKYAQGKLIF